MVETRGAPRGIRPATKKKYLEMYELRKRGFPIWEICDRYECSRQYVEKAIKYCQSLALSMTSEEDILLLIDAKALRNESGRTMHTPRRRFRPISRGRDDRTRCATLRRPMERD